MCVCVRVCVHTLCSLCVYIYIHIIENTFYKYLKLQLMNVGGGRVTKRLQTDNLLLCACALLLQLPLRFLRVKSVFLKERCKEKRKERCKDDDESDLLFFALQGEM